MIKALVRREKEILLAPNGDDKDRRGEDQQMEEDEGIRDNWIQPSESLDHSSELRKGLGWGLLMSFSLGGCVFR